MFKKLLPFILLLLFQVVKSQDEFITIWKPNLPNQYPLLGPTMPNAAGANQIWFPGIGNNYTISWEEVNYPQHNGAMTNVTSTNRILIDFGTPLNPNPADATFKVKVTNGNGTFNQIKFGENTIQPSPFMDIVLVKTSGSADKIIEIAQWGNIQWTSMNNAFAQCFFVQLTATDSPDLSSVTDASLMFYNTFNLTGNISMANWDTSSIKNFKHIFALGAHPLGAQNSTFNPPIGSWDMSSAEDISYMFMKRKAFNQNLNSWNTSKVTNMAYTFAESILFNQPLNNWDTSKVTNMGYMFHYDPNFNQPLDNWDTSSVTNMGHMFHDDINFNQYLGSWDVSKVTEMNTMFTGSTQFNQSLENWNLKALFSANNMLSNTGLDCNNYSRTLMKWSNNPNTPNNILLQDVTPLQYSLAVNSERNILLSKGWIITGDTGSECHMLGISENNLKDLVSIYPNPVTDFIYLKNIQGVKNYIILDMSGRIIMKDSLSKDEINVQTLTTGNYILQIITKDKIHSLKFIKK